jgi:hypothetical protein
VLLGAERAAPVALRELGAHAGDDLDLALRAAARGFALAVQISAPFIAFGILFNLGLGVLSRLMPQMQVFFVGLPLSILLGFVILFAATEVGIYGLVGLLDLATPLGRHAWLQIMVGNLIAALAMGFYFWRTHREIEDELRHTFDYERPDADEEPGAAPDVPSGVGAAGSDGGPERPRA